MVCNILSGFGETAVKPDKTMFWGQDHELVKILFFAHEEQKRNPCAKIQDSSFCTFHEIAMYYSESVSGI